MSNPGEGNLWFQPNEGNLYRYTSGVWLLIYSYSDPSAVLVGPTGPTGPPAEIGATGPQSLTGPTGPTAEIGATGPQGPIGSTGPPGGIGEIGSTGPKGEVGATGPQGIQGIIGPTGVQGLSVTGPTGTTRLSPLSLTGTVDAFGDSITAGAGVIASARWVSQAIAHFGATENNLGTNGDQTLDMTKRIYGVGVNPPASIGHVDGRTVMINIGINDVYGQPESAYDELKRTLEAISLYACLPASAKKDVRSAAVTKSGAWLNTPAYNKGMYTTTNGASVTAVVTGRYVVWAGAILMGASVSNHSNVSVTVDGVVINAVMPRYSGTIAVTPNGSSYVDALWLYDTGTAGTGNHTLTIAQVAQTGVGVFQNYVDWMGAFNYAHVGANPVFLTTPDTTDWNYINQLFAVNGNETKWMIYRQMLQKIVQKWNGVYGLPIYYVDMSTTNIYGQKLDDTLHPNVNGHTFLASRFIYSLTNGTYNTYQ